jgi:membrane protein YdbS with pleckstrin-like domain
MVYFLDCETREKTKNAKNIKNEFRIVLLFRMFRNPQSQWAPSNSPPKSDEGTCRCADHVFVRRLNGQREKNGYNERFKIVVPDSYRKKNSMTETELFAEILEPDETVLWSGKPNKTTFIASGWWVLAIGLLWGLMDAAFATMMFKNILTHPDPHAPPALFFIIFFFIHASPCWGSLIYLRWLFLAHRKTAYLCTDKRIIIRRGGFGISYTTIHYGQIRDITVKVGMLESRYGVGTLIFSTDIAQTIYFGLLSWNNKRFTGIERPYEVFRLVNERIKKGE